MSLEGVSKLDSDLDEILSNQSNIGKSEEEVAAQIQNAETYSWLAYLISSGGGGVIDELCALTKMGVITVNSSGIPTLVEGWHNHVDVVVLSDMDNWGESEDPDGLYRVNEDLRTQLQEHWVKSEDGWALTDEPNEILFDIEELEDWRRSFEGKVETRENRAEGIGRFGL